MNEIIEDTISRNKKFQEDRQKRVERLRELKAPASMIEYEEIVAKMTLAEYKLHLEEQEKQDKIDRIEYAKFNPIQKHIVDEIYNRVEKLEYDYWIYTSNSRFLAAIDPLKFMSNEDFDLDLYQTFLTHAQEIYEKKYSAEYNKDKKLKFDSN